MSSCLLLSHRIPSKARAEHELVPLKIYQDSKDEHLRIIPNDLRINTNLLDWRPSLKNTWFHCPTSFAKEPDGNPLKGPTALLSLQICFKQTWQFQTLATSSFLLLYSNVLVTRREEPLLVIPFAASSFFTIGRSTGGLLPAFGVGAPRMGRCRFSARGQSCACHAPQTQTGLSAWGCGCELTKRCVRVKWQHFLDYPMLPQPGEQHELEWIAWVNLNDGAEEVLIWLKNAHWANCLLKSCHFLFLSH